MTTKEPDITINGVPCTTAMAMTLRVAIEHFASDLRENGLGEDETGRAICQGYLARIDEIRRLIFR
jgi:hypothetical protein